MILVASPTRDHQTIVMELGFQMLAFAKENNLGRAHNAPFDVLFTDTDIVQQDLLFVSHEREHILTPANIRGAPDLIVEVLSSSSSSRD